MSLHSLVFSDLCIAQTGVACWFKDTPDSLNVQAVPEEYWPELEQVYTELESKQKSSFVFTLKLSETERLTMRVLRMQTLNGKIYICRRFWLKANTLLALGFPASLQQQLLKPDISSGLVVFCGKAGSGKTTTAYTFLKERLTAHGGVLWALENPPEMLLAGRHGKGVCHQIEVGSDEEMGNLTPSILRATPNYVFYGETRDANTLKQAVKLALSGHLVVTTLHAGDLISGLSRMGDFLGSEARVLAEALRFILHLDLEIYKGTMVLAKDNFTGNSPTGSPPRILGVSVLEVSDVETKSYLTKGTYDQLASVIDRQRRQKLNPNYERK